MKIIDDNKRIAGIRQEITPIKDKVKSSSILCFISDKQQRSQVALK